VFELGVRRGAPPPARYRSGDIALSRFSDVKELETE
jgi:hypothetical protein